MHPEKLHIALFGYSILSDYYNSSVTYFRGMIKELYQRGHSITFYEPEIEERLHHQDLADPDWVTVIKYRPEPEEAEKMLLNASAADIIIKAGGIGVLDEFLEKNLLLLKGMDKQVLFWDVNVAETLSSLTSNPKDPLIPMLPHYDLVLTGGGGNDVIAAYKQFGAQDCFSIPSAADPEVHLVPGPETGKPYELVFIGNRWGDRETKAEDFFLDVAELMPDKKFLLAGSGWRDKILPANVENRGYVHASDLKNCYSAGKATINITRESQLLYSDLPPKRMFEAAAAGCCLITDAWEGLTHFFEPGKEVLLARDRDEVLQHLTELTPEKARTIGRAAQQKVLKCHTYAHRIDYFEKILNLQRSSLQRLSI